jgi:hypothetical protein
LTASVRHRPRPFQIIDAITQALTDHREPMQAREVHAEVEALLGEPVRWASIKALLASDVAGASPRFLWIARGRYRIRIPSRPVG